MALSAIEEVYFQMWGKAGGSARVCRAFFDHESLKQRAATLGLLDLLDEMENEMRAGPGLA